MNPSPNPPPSSTPPAAAAAETLDLVLRHLLPLLLAATLSVKTLVTRWRLLHPKLLLLQTSLSDASLDPNSLSNPLFCDFLSSLLSPLRSLHSLSALCLDPTLPSGRLLVQSDLDIAASTLSLHLHDLSLLLRSGLLSQSQDSSSAIVLSVPAPSASRADLALFVRDSFARLQIGALDIKLKALDSLLEFLNSDPAKLCPIVSSEGDVPALLRLLDSSAHSRLVDRASSAVSLLATASASSRRAVFDEGGLGPLLRLLESGSAAVRDRAAGGIEAISADQSSAWAVSAYGGVTVLINACRPGAGSTSLQTLSVSSLKNISSMEDARISIFEEGGIPVLVDLLASGTIDSRKSSAVCLWSLACSGSDEIRSAIIHEAGLPRLIHSLHESSDQQLQENALRAIQALSLLPSASKSLSSSPLFFAQLADLITRTGTALSQQTAAALIADLSPGDEIKKSMVPCLSSLVKMMETSKPAMIQDTAARALVSLLEVKSNRKELVKDGKSMTRLVQMLDPKNEEIGKKGPVMVVLALTSGSGNGGRKRLVEGGACLFLQKLMESDVVGAKKALQRLAGGRLKNLFSLGRSS